jgi:hypothetical protein
VPAPATLDRLLAEVGLGGVIVVAVGSAAPASFLNHLEYATAAAGAGVLDTAHYVERRR